MTDARFFFATPRDAFTLASGWVAFLALSFTCDVPAFILWRGAVFDALALAILAFLAFPAVVVLLAKIELIPKTLLVH